MWNENAPLELLKELPAVLNDANLARLQQVIDYDKFINSTECGYDLCGQYAPFCEGCDKCVPYPCAVSYIKMKQAEGMDVKIQSEVEDVLSEPAEEQPAECEACEEAVEEPAEECAEECEAPVEETAEEQPEEVSEPSEECEAPAEAEEQPAEECEAPAEEEEKAEKKYIRIAIARRRV